MDRQYMDIMDLSVVDDIIRRLLKAGRESKQVGLSEGEIRQLCVISRNIFLGKPNVLRLRAPIRIAGDIHGQYDDLLRLFEVGGYPPESNYLFLGNYVDFGRSSLETLCLLLAFKVRYPENIFLLRGNHEDDKINRIHGFYDECKRRYNVRLWKIFSDCLNCLPVAALIDGKILCIHGGLSPELHNLAEIEHIERPTTIPDKGLLFDLLWSRPNWGSDSWGEEVIDGSISINTFGKDKVIEFLDNNELDLICCGNQVVEDGYEFFAKRRLVILFSAPNFRGEYDNAGASLHVDESLVCSLEILKPRERITMLRKIGSSHLTTATKSENTPGGNTSKSKAASKNTSVFLGPMPAERMSKSDTGSTNVAGAKLPESSVQETRPFKIDPANLYRSKSPGVKRFLGAKV